MSYTIISAQLRRNSLPRLGLGWFVPTWPESLEEATERMKDRRHAGYNDFAGKVSIMMMGGWHVLGAPVFDLERKRVHLAMVEDALFQALPSVQRKMPNTMAVFGRAYDPKTMWHRQEAVLNGGVFRQMRGLEGIVRNEISAGWLPLSGLSVSSGEFLCQTMVLPE